MDKVRLLFVYPHDLAGKIVDFAQGPGADPCHVGAFAFEGIFEATLKGVGVTLDLAKYDGRPVEIVEIDVPDLGACLNRWRKLDGNPYSLLGSCIAGGLHDAFHRIIHLNFHRGNNCSETISLGLRDGRLEVAPGRPAYCVTPRNLLKESYRLGGKQLAKGIFHALGAPAGGGDAFRVDPMPAGEQTA